QAVGGAGERGPPFPGGLPPGPAAGRAAVAADPRGGGEPVNRPDRPVTPHHPNPAGVPGRTSGPRPTGRRVPLGRPPRTVTIQRRSVSVAGGGPKAEWDVWPRSARTVAPAGVPPPGPPVNPTAPAAQPKRAGRWRAPPPS